MQYSDLEAVDYILNLLGDVVSLTTDFRHGFQTYYGDDEPLFEVSEHGTATIFTDTNNVDVSIHQANKLMEAFSNRREEL